MSVILFVCTGNLCRSPMAAGLLRRRLAEIRPAGRYQVRSAGVWAVDDHPASDHAITAMAERGIDITDHRARGLTNADVAEADLVLVMTNEHARTVRATWPQYGWKVYLLSEMAGKKRDVADPYGGPLEGYRACAGVLDQYISKGLERILEKA